MSETYEIEYEGIDLFSVEIEEDKAKGAIEEMVEFWMGWDYLLGYYDGDYTKAWLNQLANFIIKFGQLPSSSNEGWCKLDGSIGIKIIDWWPWSPDIDSIEIRKIEG